MRVEEQRQCRAKSQSGVGTVIAQGDSVTAGGEILAQAIA